MWKANVSAAFPLLAAMQPPALAAEGARIGEIRQRLENANHWRDHVMVAAHRGGGMEGDRKSLSIATHTFGVGIGYKF